MCSRVKTQQKVRSKRTATKKSSATAKKQKSSNGTLTTQQITDRTLCDGNVVLFQRENSKRWQCRIRRNMGTWVDYSTKQTELKKAKKVAEERYRDIVRRHINWNTQRPDLREALVHLFVYIKRHYCGIASAGPSLF